MTEKILIAIDDSENAQRAAAFVARRFSPKTPVTLLSILLDTAALCDMDSPELTPLFKAQQSSFCVLEDKKRELINASIEKAKKTLVDGGFSAGAIETKIQIKKKGVARDILAEAQKGYDLIVLGRRGVSGIKDFFMGSTSNKILNSVKDISVLIVN